jgi:hypothetical protein
MKDFLQSSVFSGFPSWTAVSFIREITPKLLRFEIAKKDGARPLYLASIISKDEKMAWQSFQGVLDHTMSLAQNSMRGFFGFDVLSVDIHNGMQNFDPKALSQLIINHSRNLGPDQKALIRYGQLFALLHYRAPAEWGKVEVKTHVEFFSQAPASPEAIEASVRAALMGSGTKNKNSPGDQLDLFLKKRLRESGGEPDAIYIVHDLSVHPVWDPANELQQQRVRDWFAKEKVLPEVYLHHGTKTIPVSTTAVPHSC